MIRVVHLSMVKVIISVSVVICFTVYALLKNYKTGALK
jgi:hypothetical protein